MAWYFEYSAGALAGRTTRNPSLGTRLHSASTRTPNTHITPPASPLAHLVVAPTQLRLGQRCPLPPPPYWPWARARAPVSPRNAAPTPWRSPRTCIQYALYLHGPWPECHAKHRRRGRSHAGCHHQPRVGTSFPARWCQTRARCHPLKPTQRPQHRRQPVLGARRMPRRPMMLWRPPRRSRPVRLALLQTSYARRISQKRRLLEAAGAGAA